MPKRSKKLLADICAAARTVAVFIEGHTRKSYGQDLMLRSAVERQIEIVGEALRRLEAHDSLLASRISESKRIIAFRNIIAHGYDILDDDIVWQAVSEKMPVLAQEAQGLLDELEGK